MLYWALVFLIVAIVAGVFGFGGGLPAGPPHIGGAATAASSDTCSGPD